MSTAWVAAFVVLWVAVLLIAVVVVGLLRRISNVLELAEAGALAAGSGGAAIGGLPVASYAPEFRVFGESGDEVRTPDLVRTPTILLFMDAHCGPCEQLAADLEPAMTEIEGVPFYVVLNQEEGRPGWLSPAVSAVYQRHGELSQAFENTATPQAYVLDPSRFVLSKRLIGSLADLRALALPQAPQNGGDTNSRSALSREGVSA
jgi:hypothetical protein